MITFTKRVLKIFVQLLKKERNLKTLILETQRWHGNALFYRLTGYRIYTRKGIPPTSDSYPYIAGMSFRNRCSLIYDEFRKDSANRITADHQVVFIKIDFIHEFFEKVMPEIQHVVTIVTHNSDDDFGEHFIPYLEHPKVAKWYSINVVFSHPKLHSIPLGLGEKKWIHGDTEKIATSTMSPSVKKHTAYLNFTSENWPQERVKVATHFANTSWVYNSKRVPFPQYLEDVKSSKYVISPRGIGMDCHRIWESILLGAIPIVLNCTFISHYRDLPILIVDKWEDVTEDFLHQQYDEIKKKQDLSRLYLDYWIKEIGLLEIHEPCVR